MVALTVVCVVALIVKASYHNDTIHTAALTTWNHCFGVCSSAVMLGARRHMHRSTLLIIQAAYGCITRKVNLASW